MEKADVVFFKRKDNWISNTIASLTSSEYTHVGLVISDNNKDNHGIIIEADRFIKTRVRDFTFDPSLHSLYRVPNLTERQKRDIVSFALSLKGTSYDYLQIFGLLIRLLFKLNMSLFNRANYIICSELIDKAFYTSGVERKSNYEIGNVTPQDLLKCYDFQLINTSV